MRIISGKYKGRQLNAAADRSIRPTTNRIKEYLFGLLDDLVEETNVLDLFSGAGGLGLEALSRGASSVHFVDLAHSSLRVLRRNIEHISVDEPVTITKKDAMVFLRANEAPFDLIFADPPFAWNNYQYFLELVFLENNLTKHGLVVIESEKSHMAIWDGDGRKVLRQKTFDRSLITILGREESS